MAENDWISALARLTNRGLPGDTELHAGSPFSGPFSRTERAETGGVEALPLGDPADPISQIAMILAPFLTRGMTAAHLRSVPSGMQRLYRGETTLPPRTPPEWIAQDPAYQASSQASGRWWTGDPATAQWYVNEAKPDARMVWQDVPRDVAAQSHLPQQPPAIQRYSIDPQAEYFLPPEYVARGHVIPPELSRMISPRRFLGSQRGSTGGEGSLEELKRLTIAREGTPGTESRIPVPSSADAERMAAQHAREFPARDLSRMPLDPVPQSARHAEVNRYVDALPMNIKGLLALKDATWAPGEYEYALARWMVKRGSGTHYKPFPGVSTH